MNKLYFCIVFAVFVLLFILPEYSFSSDAWDFLVEPSLRVDVQKKDSDEDQALLRFSANREKQFTKVLPRPLHFSIFSEARYNYNPAVWGRVETGIECGYDICKWLYFGEALQYAFLDPAQDTLEFESRLVSSFFFGEEVFPSPVELYLFEEYTYGFRAGEATRNEVGAGFGYPLGKNLNIKIGWRHVDRIHDFDSDQVELVARYHFN